MAKKMKPALKPTQREPKVARVVSLVSSRTRQLLLAGAFIIVSGVLLITALFHLREEAMQSGERLNASLAHIVEEQTARSIQLIDQRLQAVQTGLAQLEVAGQLGELTSRSLLKQQLANLPLVRAIWVLNAEGRIKFDSDTGNIGLNLADRDYFQIYLAQPQTTLYVGLPIRSRTTGAWLISVARPVHAAGGRFDGVIVAALQPSDMEALWRLPAPWAESSITLWRRSGVLLMQSPADDAAMGKDFAATTLFQKWLPASPADAYQGTSPFDGSPRSVAYHTLSTQPDLVVSVSESVANILKPWRYFAWLAVGIWLSGTILLMAFGALLNRMWQQGLDTEAALKESGERYRALVECSPEPCFVHRGSDIIFVNPAAVKMFAATSAQDVVSRNLLDLVHPSSQHIILARLKNLASGETENTLYELKFVRLDGNTIDIELRGTMITFEGALAVQCSMRDITAAREAETALRMSEAAMAEAQRVAHVGSWRWDALTNIVEWSDELYRIFDRDLSWSAPSHESHLKLYTDESAARLNDALQKAMLTGDAYNLDLERHCADGQRRYIGARGEALRNGSGKIVGLRGTAQDITEHKRADATRASLEAQLREAQKMQAIGTLAGGIAHDFNNILATILGNTTLARQDMAGNPLALQSLDEIAKAGARARDLVQQILSFSRREPTQKKPIALDSVVNESVGLLRASLPSRIALDVQCDAQLPLVLADVKQIQQVVINLVTNAVQAMRDRSGRIAIRLGAVLVDNTLVVAFPALHAIGANHHNRTVKLVVSDDGPGMDAATLARIFEPFFTTKAVDEGTGLGLSVVHGIVQAHEGVIVVDSRPGEGASFTVYLPCTDASASAQDARQGAPSHAVPAVTPAASRQHILYIDDDEALVFLVRRTLERRGYRVSGYTDQREALAALRTDPSAFDLVITDYNMPGMSGLDVARAVREIRADLPLVIASGFIDETLLAEADGAGVRELIFKANAIEDLCDAFARLLHKVGNGTGATSTK